MSCWNTFNEHTKTCNKIIELKREIEVLRKIELVENAYRNDEINAKKEMTNHLRTDLLKQRMYMETFCPRLLTFCAFLSKCDT